MIVLLSEFGKEILDKDIPVQGYNRYIPQAADYYEATMTPIGNQFFKEGILLPDISVLEFFHSYEASRVGSIVLLVIERMLRKQDIINEYSNIDALLFASFTAYHELGHWYDYLENYKNKGVSGQSYLNEFSKEEQLLGLAALKHKINERGIDRKLQNELILKFHSIYRENPFEKRADIFAMEKLKLHYSDIELKYVSRIYS